MMEAVLTWDGLRWVNSILSLVVVGLLSAGARIRWSTTPIRIKHMIPWIVLTYSIIAYGSVEVALDDGVASPGLRVMLLTLNLSGLIVASLYGMGDSEQHVEPLNLRGLLSVHTGRNRERKG